MKINFETKKTKDYSLFEFRPENRPLNQRQIVRLHDRIKEVGYAENLPILVSRHGAKLSIIDGQHRFEACKSLGEPIHYQVIDETIAVETMIERNAFHLGWTIQNFIDFYAERGNPHYKALQGFMSKYRINFDIAHQLLNILPKKEHYSYNTLAHNGKFQTNQARIDAAKETMRKATDILELNVHTKNVRRTSSLLRALIQLVTHGDYDEGKMLDRLSKCSTRFVTCGSRSDYVTLLNSIYNYNAKNRVDIRDRRTKAITENRVN